MEPVIRATKGERAILLPSLNHDNYVKDYTITWYKKGEGNKKTFLTSQSYLKGPVLEVYREYTIPKTSFEDSGDYIVRVQTQFDFDQKIVTLLIQHFPEPPMNVQVQNIQNSVKVSFEPGFNNYANIESYDIEFAVLSLTNGTLSTGKWKKVKTVEHKGAQLSHQLAIVTDRLIPFTKYTVRVRARNQVGLSVESREDDQSHCLITTEPARPERNPEILEIVGSKPAEILVRWRAIPSVYYNASHFQYLLEYCQNDDPNQLCEQCPADQWRREYLAATSTHFVIKNSTVPYRRFSIKLRSKNSVNLAPSPLCKIAFSGEARPNAAPGNLAENNAVASAVGKHFISLHWDELGEQQLNGKLKEYIVKYKVGDSGATGQAAWEMLNGEAERDTVRNEGIILQHLQPGRAYLIIVAAVNGAGEGPFSQPLLVTTKEDIPGPPVELKVTQIWPDRLEISWKKPQQPNGVITG